MENVPGQRLPTEHSTPVDRIVVAVGVGRASVGALMWGLRHAAEHGLRVEVVTAWPLHGAVFVREVAGHFCEPRWRAREIQAAAVAEALAAVDAAPPYELRVVNADVVDALTRARNRAVMVVIGSDSPAGETPTGTRLSDRLRRAIPGPVVVVGPEVVGHGLLDRRPARRGPRAE